MRSAPAVRVRVVPGFVDRVLPAMMLAAAAAVSVVWYGGRREWPAANSLLAALAAAGAVIVVVVMRRSSAPRQLDWDTQRWWLSTLDRDDAKPGSLHVLFDLGPLMLLRFDAAGARAAKWLVVSRSGLEAQWHALRCAVYSPRPSEAQGAPADGADPQRATNDSS